MKYLITQDQVKELVDFVEAFMGVDPVCEELAILRSLKPIEPLTEDQIAFIRFKFNQRNFPVNHSNFKEYANAVYSAITGEQS